MSKKIIEKDTAESRRYITSFYMYAIKKHSDMLDDEAKEKTAAYREALIDLGANPKDVDAYENFIKKAITGVVPCTYEAIYKYKTPIVISLYKRLVDEAINEGADEVIMINNRPDDGYDE